MMQKIMFAISKIFIVAIFIAFCNVSYANDGSIDGGHNYICGKSSLCSAFFEREATEVEKICDPSKFSAVWKKESEKYLFQCRGGDTSEDDYNNWIVDVRQGFFFKINSGRFYDKNILANNQNIKIQDSFQERPLCDAAIAAKLKASDFVLLDKRPSDDERNPYCYEPIYLKISRGKLFVLKNEGKPKTDDAHLQVHSVSPSERAVLRFLLHSLR